MKNNFKYLYFAPLFMAVLCDPIEDECALADTESYIVNVEDIKETYTSNETIWLNAQTTSMLIDYCTEGEEPELIEDVLVFLDGLFVLKLNNSSALNAEVYDTPTVTYDIGEEYSFNGCKDAINFIPVLSDDELFYEYRLGIAIETPGDYCIVNARNSYFNLDAENNSQIFQEYDILEDKIKWNSCQTTYTRNRTEGYYFFKIQ